MNRRADQRTAFLRPTTTAMTLPTSGSDLVTREILLSFWKVHILHHASEGPLYGQWIADELRRHGYKISPGTLYPLLESLEKRGYLVSRRERVGRSVRRLYKATPFGRKALVVARRQARELFSELLEHQEEPRRRS